MTDQAARGQIARFGRAVGSRMAGSLKGESQRLEALMLAERAHDPDRTLERGYALVADDEGDSITSAAAARDSDSVVIRFADDSVPARIDHERE